MIRPSSTLTEVAFSVCTALHRAGYTVVMTGGSAATFYAPRAYVSDDIDFVITLKGTGGEEALKQLGYHRKGDYYVMHPRGFRLSSRPDRWRLVTSSSMGGRPSAERGSFSMCSAQRTPAEIGSLPSCSGMTSAA